jgi:uridylate kinase
MQEIFVISLGGSIIVPDEIDVSFIKKFRSLILKHAKESKFIIVCGGGRTARKYQSAARSITKVSNEELDWIGITGTKLNARLMKAVFGKFACNEIILDPTKKINIKKIKENIVLASGWEPGCSTDYDAVLIAKQTGARIVINLTNTDYVYDKDPRSHRDAKPIKKIAWKNFLNITGAKWEPGLNMPFDPIAAKKAGTLGIKVIIANGKNLKNIEKIFKGKEFIGTLIV